MDFLLDGCLVISIWDVDGSVYIVDGVSSGDFSQMLYKCIVVGLVELLGVKVVDGLIYVL